MMLSKLKNVNCTPSTTLPPLCWLAHVIDSLIHYPSSIHALLQKLTHDSNGVFLGHLAPNLRVLCIHIALVNLVDNSRHIPNQTLAQLRVSAMLGYGSVTEGRENEVKVADLWKGSMLLFF